MVAKIYHIEYKKKKKTKKEKQKQKTKQNKENSTEKKILEDFFFIQNTVHITKVSEFSGTCYKFKTN